MTSSNAWARKVGDRVSTGRPAADVCRYRGNLPLVRERTIGSGTEFLQELRSTYDRIVQGPLKYQELRSGIRRALIRRFPYAVYLRSKSKLLSCLRCSMRAENQPSGSDAELNRLLKCNRLTAILGVHPSDPSLFHYLFSRMVMNWRTEFQLKGTEVKVVNRALKWDTDDDGFPYTWHIITQGATSKRMIPRVLTDLKELR